MTLRIYYQDSTACEFEAKIVDKSLTENGPSVQLDQTAFYPTSGGQPHDIGTLGGVQVLDVWEDEEGNIWHGLEMFPDKEVVFGLVDWSRRFDHMQQHTGQHVLSAVFLDEVNTNTIGFHMGAESSTIDLDISSLSDDAIRKVEINANRIVWENRPVNIHFIDDSEVGEIPFRKPPQVSGRIRVIWVDGIDASACGGTHVRNTGAIGIIKITGKERYKGGVRVTFLCGQRGLKDYQRVLGTIQRVSTPLSIHQNELEETILRMQAENKNTRQKLVKTRNNLMMYEAKKIWDETPAIDEIRKIAAHWDEFSFEDIQSIAERLRQYPKTLILLAATEDERIRVLCTRSEDLPNVDCSLILRNACEDLGGRGGGSPAMARGGAPETDHINILSVFQKTLLGT